jgi:acetylornithine/succinyldiaminopimelate/putrescine aminotransferase
VLDRYAKHVNSSLASLARLIAAPVEVAAAGSKVQGSDGHTYLDCGGFGVFLLGHCHPVVVAAVREQLGRNPVATRLFLNSELAQAAADLAGITPDVLLTGKILGGGVMPVGGAVASAQLFAPLNADPLLHSSTFSGSPLAAAAVSATIGAIKSEGLIERARELGPQIRDVAVGAVTTHCPHLVTEVRSEGLLIGVDFASADAATEFLIGLLDEHVIPSYSLNSSNVLRLTPPAILDAADLDWLRRALTSAAKHVSRVIPAAATIRS